MGAPSPTAVSVTADSYFQLELHPLTLGNPSSRHTRPVGIKRTIPKRALSHGQPLLSQQL